MSWDVFLVHHSEALPIANPDDISTDLGSKTEVISALKRSFPSVSFADGMWGFLDDGDFSIEFNLGSADPVNYVALYVRGSDRVIGTIQRICAQTGWRAFDTTIGSFMDFSPNSASGLQRWRNTRDQVMNHLEA